MGSLVGPPCSRNPHDERGGMTPVLIPCSRSAHDQNVLARRPQWDQHGCHSKREKQASLEGPFVESLAPILAGFMEQDMPVGLLSD